MLRQIIEKCNQFLGDKFIYFIFFSIICGIFFDKFLSPLSIFSTGFLMLMMLSMALQCNVKDFARVWEYPFEIVTAAAIIYGVLPIINWVLAMAFYRGNPLLGTGQVLISAIPPGITSSIWTGIAGGNIPLAITIIAITNIFSIFLTPLIMHISVGSVVSMDAQGLMLKLFQIVIIPIFIGVFLREKKPKLVHRTLLPMNLLSKICLLILLLGNTATITPYFSQIQGKILIVFFTVGLQSIIAFSFSFFVTAKLLHKDEQKVYAFTYTSGIRNNGAAVVIAMNYFGPIVAVPVIVNTLFQQPIASLIYRFTHKKRRTY
jgi:predicted Na+-dependent transporter